MPVLILGVRALARNNITNARRTPIALRTATVTYAFDNISLCRGFAFKLEGLNITLLLEWQTVLSFNAI